MIIWASGHIVVINKLSHYHHNDDTAANLNMNSKKGGVSMGLGTILGIHSLKKY